MFAELDSEFRVLSAGDENAGRGLTIQNLHCSEVSRWPGDAAATLAGLRAALAPRGEMVLESTPNGAYGCFYEEWVRAEESGTVRHFFPWWMEPAYAGAAVGSAEEERELMRAHGLDGGADRLSAGLEGVSRAAVAGVCGGRGELLQGDGGVLLRRGGGGAADGRLARRWRRGMAGRLQIWLPPVPGSEYLVAVDTAGGGADGDYRGGAGDRSGDRAAVRGAAGAAGDAGAGAGGGGAWGGSMRGVRLRWNGITMGRRCWRTWMR